MIKQKILLYALSLLAIYFSGCASVKPPSEVYTQPDYTQEEAFNAEVERIKKILETDSIQALWRVVLLEQNGIENTQEIKTLCLDKLAQDYTQALDTKDYVTLSKITISLNACNINDARFTLEKKVLDSMIQEAVLAYNVPANQASTKVSSLISGTVTIFVDKGIKVENGMGYTDGVIGSGFFIDKDGTIVTNHHVISDMVNPKYEGFCRLYVRLADDPDTKIPAKVIGYDEMLDIALVKVNITSPYVFSLGSSSDLDIGDKVYAIGSPIGLEKTLTSGILSAYRNDILPMGHVLQIDAAINQGNSGGPLIDQKGAVQGIVFAGMLRYAGLNFVIPVEYLKNELIFLYNGGKRTHSWLGCFGKTLRQQTLDTGLQTLYVMPASPAFRSGIKEGDIITKIAGLTVNNLEDMQQAMMKTAQGTLVNVEYERQDDTDIDKVQKLSALVYLDTRPKSPGYKIFQSDLLSNSFVPIYGIKLTNVSTTNSRKYTIQSVIKGSIAEMYGFSENDPIDINQVQFDEDKSIILTDFFTKKRKSGFLDLSMRVAASLDSSYYF